MYMSFNIMSKNDTGYSVQKNPNNPRSKVRAYCERDEKGCIVKYPLRTLEQHKADLKVGLSYSKYFRSVSMNNIYFLLDS
jgi:hypothetical protein